MQTEIEYLERKIERMHQKPSLSANETLVSIIRNKLQKKLIFFKFDNMVYYLIQIYIYIIYYILFIILYIYI